MNHYALRKYRGPATWALVRDAYLAGEPAPIVAKRYDVSLANLRRKALQEGWTRRAYAKAEDRAPQAQRADRIGRAADGARFEPASVEPAFPEPTAADPAPADAPTLKAALASALGRAAADLAAGRSAEALAALKAGEALQRLSGALAPDTLPLSDDEAAQALDDRRAAVAEMRDQTIVMAEAVALALLSDPPAGVGAPFTPWLYRWRAEHLGQEAARADFHRAVDAGWASRLWDGEGNLRPFAPAAAPSDAMQAQHARACEWRTQRGYESAHEGLG